VTDICKCSGKGCPKAKLCHRTVAPAGVRQTFFMVPPLDRDTLECDYYWPATIRLETNDDDTAVQDPRK